MTTSPNLSIRAKRVFKYLLTNGPEQAEHLPTYVAVKYVSYATNAVEQAYDNAVTELLDAGYAVSFDGTDGYTYITVA